MKERKQRTTKAALIESLKNAKPLKLEKNMKREKYNKPKRVEKFCSTCKKFEPDTRVCSCCRLSNCKVFIYRTYFYKNKSGKTPARNDYICSKCRNRILGETE